MEPRNFRIFSLLKILCGDWPDVWAISDVGSGGYIGHANEGLLGHWAPATMASESVKAICRDRGAVRDDLNGEHPGAIVNSERQADA